MANAELLPTPKQPTSWLTLLPPRLRRLLSPVWQSVGGSVEGIRIVQGQPIIVRTATGNRVSRPGAWRTTWLAVTASEHDPELLDAGDPLFGVRGPRRYAGGYPPCRAVIASALQAKRRPRRATSWASGT